MNGVYPGGNDLCVIRMGGEPVMLFIPYRLLPESTAYPNLIYFYDHNVYDRDDNRWGRR